MAKSIVLIGNSAAGLGNLESHFRRAKRALWGREILCLTPSSPAELTEICRTLDPSKTEAAIIIGGDGTVNTAIAGLLQSRVPLITFPAGTANDLASELNVQANWSQIQTLLDEKKTKYIDVIEMNGIPVATVAGIGLGAKVTGEYNSKRATSKAFKKISTRMKSGVYTLLSVKSILGNWNTSNHLHIRANGFDEKIQTAAMFICNQGKLGGDLTLSEGVRNDDSHFQVIIIPYKSDIRMFGALLGMKRGKPSPDFISFSTTEMNITDLNNQDIDIFGDGEAFNREKQVQFRIKPAALEVYYQ